jgi:flavin reductase (DIM6/NTAB) family NADH-FMN oxidoreductase RutF
VIDQQLKRSLGQMMHAVQVVAATGAEGTTRAYTSHWVTQVSFEEAVVMASISPKHDTYPLIVESGRFSVSMLAGDQIEAGQYFSYPGRRFRHIAGELLHEVDGWTVVPGCIAWLGCKVFQQVPMRDHQLVFADVVAYGPGRLKEPPLLYSSRLGWRICGDRAREPGDSIRDRLLARLGDAGEADEAGEDSR